jgi:hypothetical protein
MPNINLRLTEEEHAALREWAHGSRRSIQREVIFRLFSELKEGAVVGYSAVSGSAPSMREEEAGVIGRTAPRPERTVPSSSSGPCGMNTPAGTKCKVCGKVHPL